jgi:hypothetical protein
MSRKIGGSAAEDDWDIDSSVAREVEKTPARDLLDRELLTSAGVCGCARRDDPSRYGRPRRRASDRKNAIAIEPYGAAAKRPFKCRGVEGVSNECVDGTDRKQVHRTAPRHSE